jgi:hypothetical protein
MAERTTGADDIGTRLRTMRALDFEFATDHDDDGGIVALVGVRLHHGVIDIFELYGEDEANATRLPDTETNILLARTVLWHTRGSAYEVIDALLALPDPEPGRVADGEPLSWQTPVHQHRHERSGGQRN